MVVVLVVVLVVVVLVLMVLVIPVPIVVSLSVRSLLTCSDRLAFELQTITLWKALRKFSDKNAYLNTIYGKNKCVSY